MKHPPQHQPMPPREGFAKRLFASSAALIICAMTIPSQAQTTGTTNVPKKKIIYELQPIIAAPADGSMLPISLSTSINKKEEIEGQPTRGPRDKEISWTADRGGPVFLSQSKPSSQSSTSTENDTPPNRGSAVKLDFLQPFVKQSEPEDRKVQVTATYIPSQEEETSAGSTEGTNTDAYSLPPAVKESPREEEVSLTYLDFWIAGSEESDDDVLIVRPTTAQSSDQDKKVIHWAKVVVKHSVPGELPLLLQSAGSQPVYFYGEQNDPNQLSEEPELKEVLEQPYAKDQYFWVGTDAKGEGTATIQAQGNLGTGYKNAPEQKTLKLVPVEVAPEVLAVNSDFDEGRIDPATGYAIPDCDDINIALEAVRNHLDGKFAVNERITHDMHKGFFGVNPSNLDDNFWAGANVTIRKIDKIDPATGHPESGHLRLYGKWGNGPSEYRAITPYNFETLATQNLAAGGINKVLGESVYGATSPFPDGTSYFIEGVHPGKITLEWRYQKGSIDVKYEQSFRIFTKKSAPQWRFDLDYKIRLETSNDPSGEIRTIGYPLLSEGYTANIERAAEFYDFYRECFHQPLRSYPTGYPNAMSWAGLARLAGSQAIGGLSDSEWGKRSLQGSILVPAVNLALNPLISDWSVSEIEDIQMALFQGGWEIFASMGWQHHAFRSSGYEAIEWVATNTQDSDAPLLLGAWSDFRQGVLDHDKILIDSAALRITDREQNHVIVPTWTVISGLGIGLAGDMFSILAKNTCAPAGLDFTDLFDVSTLPRSTPPKPLGNLAVAAYRWVWIEPRTVGGILDTWNTQPMSRKLSLTGDSLKSDAMRFSIFSKVSPHIPILLQDDADIP
jgi:hypothetical protein